MKSIWRGLRILHVTARYRLDLLLPSNLPFPIRVLLFLLPARWIYRAKQSPEANLRAALESLGPIFVKFGQILSTRRDLLPPALAVELAKLQDQVPPFDSELAKRTIEKSLNQRIDELFDRFDEKPLASASIAQVHSAKLKTGEEVVVKVIRPGIRSTIEHDLALIGLIAKLISRLPDGRRLRPVEVVEDYRATVLDELDLMKEGANATTLKRNFADGDMLYVPSIYWDYSRSNVLVMERIYGVPISDIETLKAHNVDFRVLAEKGVEIFFTQVFRDSFFHADMHPGNVFVDISDPANPGYIGIDCGIVGTLSDDDQNYLAQNLIAFFNHDYHRVAALHVESGWVPPQTPVREFEGAIRAVCEPIFEKPLAEISFGQVLIRLFQTARRFDMQVQPQLVLLQKTLLNIEGLGRQLYPQLDLWQTAKPFLERWMRDRLGPKRLLKQVKARAPEWIDRLPQLPDHIWHALQVQQEQARMLDKQQKNIDRLARELKFQRQQKQAWLLTGVLLLVAWVLLPDGQQIHTWQNWQLSQWACIAAAGVALAWPSIYRFLGSDND
ncbi:ubiquinone biosynthesis regulatory protein kinase UbiB [Salinibius halmophilus]|uniref:ubiquinone biosynthesis regulatory protein kinase UbiB n=1 Tax=Salinibius halmophilus TaxID=1853216 RepID=UPI000E66C0AC|nr:ubiquinone biosynthesis regulatory protein kinase UbiB [Salinibius halmophilus]